MNAGQSKGQTYYAPKDTKSVVVNIDQAVNGSYPVLRFPARGYVQNAFIIGDVGTSGTNLMQASLINGGLDGSGTVITAPISRGTVLFGSAYTLTIDSSGPDSYNEGEWVMVKLTTSKTPTDLSVQVDFAINPTPLDQTSPLNPPLA
ncbi:MAG TPA: hypothetical protein VG265_07335 [Gaiellaceae bacterium]|nr:hypothetical protein [Gaiellaceae bacterium]